MTEPEVFLARWRAETPAFLRVLKALPGDRLDYRPHERSPSARELVWTLVGERKACVELIDSGHARWTPMQSLGHDELIVTFERYQAELDARLARLGEETWTRRAQLVLPGDIVIEHPISEYLWYTLLDGIHHRGQLTVYIRPMGGRVPSVYGASGDERRPAS